MAKMGKELWQAHFTDIEEIEVKKTDPNQSDSHLTVTTWVAGTFAYDLVSSYQIIFCNDFTT
ncbi:hypothetical protein [Gilliamella sp.]|uniref:hypothetical protein n=2 Tax=Gilliamella TaxID=1193503 RepID=UPI0025FFAD2A|nr:hypothetical protein [Gilliamella sp.]